MLGLLRNDLVDSNKWRSIKARTKRLKFGRSGVHAWGLFALEPIDPDEFVVEYTGELIRIALSDVRERQYRERGVEDYLFRIDDEWVVDATVRGGLARFINHSCEPNCYTKIFAVDGIKHIGIYAKRRIMPTEELFYDYKFNYEEMGAKIPCWCGAKTCRKWMN